MPLFLVTNALETSVDEHEAMEVVFKGLLKCRGRRPLSAPARKFQQYDEPCRI